MEKLLEGKIEELGLILNEVSSSKQMSTELADSLSMLTEIISSMPSIMEDKISKIMPLIEELSKTIDTVKKMEGKAGKDAVVDYPMIIDSVIELLPSPEKGQDGKDGVIADTQELTDEINKIDGKVKWSVLEDFDSIVNQNTLKLALETLENQVRFLIQRQSPAGTGGGIVSINGDTTAAQTIVAGTGIAVSTVGGVTTIDAIGGSMLPLPQYHIYNGDAGGAAQDSGTNFLWDETLFKLDIGDLADASGKTKLLLNNNTRTIRLTANEAGGTGLDVGLSVDGDGQITSIGDFAGGGVLVSADQLQEIAFMGNSNAFIQTDGITENLKGWITGNQSFFVDANVAAFGYGAAASIASNKNSAYFGNSAGANDADGTFNAVFGYGAATSWTSGNNYNTLLGASTDTSDGVSIAIAIGYGAISRKNWAVIGGDIANDGIGESHTLSWGKGSIANDPSSVNGTYDLRNTDYNDGIVADGVGGIMRFMHGDTTGTGAFGMYQFMGTISNDTTGDTPNERVLFEQKQGTSRVTTDATVVNGVLIDALPDGAYNIHFKISCAEIAGTGWATLEVQNGFDMASGTFTTSDPDTIETHGTSTFTDPSTGVSFEIKGGGTGLGFKLRGVAETDINWTIAWEITYAPH